MDFKDMDLSPELREKAKACKTPEELLDFEVDPSWEWSWYDPHALDGFEERIVEAYASLHGLPPNFKGVVARMFVVQRAYVNEVAALC